MKERPILFRDEMVRAILGNRKTQTRRIVKPQDMVREADHGPELWTGFLGWQSAEALLVDPGLSTNKQTECPYGRAGDRLWVREAWAVHEGGVVRDAAGGVMDAYDTEIIYRASRGRSSWRKWRPSIHMPRKYSRIILQLRKVRVERLQTINESDAIAEGIERIDDPRGVAWKSYEIIHTGRHKGEPHPHAAAPNKSPITSYRELWESINGRGAWEVNPWVWVVAFERLNTTPGVKSVA